MKSRVGLAAVAVLVVATGLHATPPAPAQRARPREPAQRMLELVNQERQRRDLPPLVWSKELARLARRHAEDMKRAGRLSHLSLADNADYSDRLVAADLPALTAAENIARGKDIDDAHSGLMNSAGHRRNILNPALERIGIGVAGDEARRTIWICQDFATLIPRLSDSEARQHLRGALARAWHAARGSLRENNQVSDRLRGALDRMVDADRVNAGFIEVPGPAWVYAYTTADPSQLPDSVLARAGSTSNYGAAIGFRRTPSTPLGLYWVAIALTGQAGRSGR